MTQAVKQALKRCDLLGFFTHPGTSNDYLRLVKRTIDNRSVSTIYYHNLHTLYLYFTSKSCKRTFENKTVIVDGMVLLFIHKLARFQFSREYRVTYVEFIIPLMKLARDSGWRVFHIGQDADTLDTALAKIRSKVPGIEITGHHGYFDLTHSSNETQQVIKRVNDFSTDLLLVGLGSPAQELWVDTYRDQLNSSVVMTCGSCMDYVAGKVKAAPRWMSRIGLEAIFRIYADPKRVAFRYLVEPFILGFILLRNWLCQLGKPKHK